LAAAIQQSMGVESELVKGGGGIFDVEVDGRRIYCKDDTGRFPTHEEIITQIQSI
jgi:selT/selW/selH-like putative selenoprotein